MLSAISQTFQRIQRRSLATGAVYIRDLPRWCNEKRLYDTAHPHSSNVYGIWIQGQTTKVRTQSSNRLGRHPQRPAAIRITTEEPPTTIYEISKLPQPTEEEIEQIRDATVQIVKSLQSCGIAAKPVTNEPDMFQRRAGLVMKAGPESRTFDRITTGRPWFTKGMVDGYRKGFMEARDKAEVEDILDQASKSDDEMKFLTEYLEYVAGNPQPKAP
ncbi:hypothetical protein GGF39_002337 [Coemansia sp. RSA 1721]|nr:hypothetical protein GGF39_002337 [Coemansia sp. RSA 1721]